MHHCLVGTHSDLLYFLEQWAIILVTSPHISLRLYSDPQREKEKLTVSPTTVLDCQYKDALHGLCGIFAKYVIFDHDHTCPPTPPQ